MKLVRYLFLIVLVAGCKTNADTEMTLADACDKCYRSNLRFIDTLHTLADIDSLAYRNFRNHDYTLLDIGLKTNAYDEKELFERAYAKLRYDIEYVDVAGDIGMPDYDRYNETMWKLLYEKYGIHQGILKNESAEKYRQFKEENGLK